MSKIFEGIDFSGFDVIKKMDEERAAAEKASANIGFTELPLGAIVEDPDQPRTSFAADALGELAASIKARGVLQAIVVRPADANGKHILVAGARRFRASRLAGKTTIPVFVRQVEADGYDQMIENIQRENLSHRDTARFVGSERAKGRKPSEIAETLGKDASWVSRYSAVSTMDESLLDRLEELGIRAAYELHKAIKIDRAATLTFLSDRSHIPTREAEDFHRSLKLPKAQPVSAMADASDFDDSSALAFAEADSPATAIPSRPSAATAVPSVPGREKLSVAILVGYNGRVGRLVIEQPAEQGSQFAVVSFDNGALIEEISVSDLSLVEVMRLG